MNLTFWWLVLPLQVPDVQDPIQADTTDPLKEKVELWVPDQHEVLNGSNFYT